MYKLSDDNPYDILELSFEADKSAIKKAFAQKNRGDSQERNRVRQAFDFLRDSETRLQVDALTPPFSSAENMDQLLDEIQQQIADTNDWLSFLDQSVLLQQDLQALLEANLHSILGQLKPPSIQLELSPLLDGLDEFREELLS